VTGEVEQPDLTLAGHRNPTHPQCDCFNILPTAIPTLVVGFVISADAELVVLRVGHHKIVDIEIGSLLILEQQSFVTAISGLIIGGVLNLYSSLLIALPTFDYVSVTVDKKKAGILELLGSV
jgi:hypothetical protein